MATKLSVSLFKLRLINDLCEDLVDLLALPFLFILLGDFVLDVEGDCIEFGC